MNLPATFFFVVDVGILKLYEKVTKYDATTKLKMTNLKTRWGFYRHMKNCYAFFAEQGYEISMGHYQYHVFLAQQEQLT